MKLPLPALVFALIAALASASLSARPGFPGAGPAGPGHPDGLFFMEMMAGELGLTEEQQTAITELVNAFRLDSAVDRERVSQIRQQLRALSQSDAGFDSAAAGELAVELAALVSSMAVSSAELHYQIRQLLTDEQRALIDQFPRGMHGGRFDAESQHP